MRRQRQSTCGILILVTWGGLCWNWPNVALTRTTEGDTKAVVAGNTEFALDLYARLRDSGGNLFLSPYSISTALAMTYSGAAGETARQMAGVLHFSMARELLHPAFAELESSIRAAGDGSSCTIHTANALWGQQGYGFLDEFLTINRTYYGAGSREVDFVGAAEQARQTINSWVAEQTEQIIKELLQKGDLDPNDVLVLTNAIYFKGKWASRFDRQRTEDAPFRTSETDQVVVPTMRQVSNFPFAAGDELDMLALPYEGNRLSMVILLPNSTAQSYSPSTT